MTQTTTNSADGTSNTLGVAKVFEDWQISCLTGAPPSQCQMLHAAATQEDDSSAFRLTLSSGAEDKAPYGVITVPVGVYLANGIEIFVDGRRPLKVLFEICDQRGCYAGIFAEIDIMPASATHVEPRSQVPVNRRDPLDAVLDSDRCD
jgi:invasion protein IalB